ncbi:fructosamine kinase family protein [Oceanispirochaeta sp.]|jgi:protein-ribulosamine 3-kinase|uniref:fructosamine kinase family protein n=1 Tax=Oceanispirochaeta sp. TaxID=2035350 RepID=UPI00260FE1CA|nr:fructosamine kinase family protein [Oceanispirochaeta sp.]MDA3958488.1 fructosamine kinase family protein [Oceanispirochaeta sp.]
MTPFPWYGSLQEALEALAGTDIMVRTERSIGGGCISSCSVLTLSTGRQIFIKRNTAVSQDMFLQEAAGLKALAQCRGAPGVPEVFSGGTEGAFSFLLMEYLAPGSRQSSFWEDFGRSLALLHKNDRRICCGFDSDNYIGASRQLNSPIESWIEFFRICRLEYQLKMARDKGRVDRDMVSQLERVMLHLDQVLIPCGEGRSSLLHGDLWSGNFICGPDGKAWILDPAPYYGHREADLAMTELFGGFEPSFYRAYEKEWPLDPGYPERRDLYNLYHMLNHLNLFGGSYKGSVQAIARRYT